MVMNAGTYGTWYNQSIAISFCDVNSNGGVPVSGASYSASSCTFGPPVTSSPTNGQTSVNLPVSFNWNDISGASPQYRIQVSKSNSGWTAANGFTTSTDCNSTVVVNRNTGSTSFFSWSSLISNDVCIIPQSNTTYYWTVKSYVCGASSNYSAVKSFTTSGGASSYTISTSSSPSAGGSTSGGGTYSSGQSCTVTASANSGYTFTNWTESGTQVSTNASYAFTVSANRTLVANFTASGSICVTCPSWDYSKVPGTTWQTHTSSISSGGCRIYRMGVTAGRTYSFKTGCGDGASANFDTYLELMNDGCSVLAFNDDFCNSTSSQIEWTASYSGYAYLKVRGYNNNAFGGYTLSYLSTIPVSNYTISTSSSPSAGGSTSGAGTYSAGQSCIVSATANSGYTFLNWTENGTQVSTNASYSFAVSSNRVLIANFSCNLPSTVIVSGGGTYCNSKMISASGGNGGTIYYQGTTSNGTSTSFPFTSISVGSTGTYYFRALNSCGWGPQGSATVTINTEPTAVSVSGGGTHCNSTTLYASGGSGGTIYWQGTNSNGTSTTTPTNSYTVTSTGTYYFRAYNNCGWGPAGSASVTINTPPSPVSVSGGGSFCSSATLSATGGSGGTIYWQGTNSNGTSTATPANSYTVSATGTYYFRAKNSCGWGTPGSVSVTINDPPSSVIVSGGGTHCNSTVLYASGGSGGTVYWQGTNSNGTSTSTPASSQTVTASGTY